MGSGEASAIGARARMIRRRRGLPLEVVAGLVGISAPYLSMLERGLRGFSRRGLLEDLAEALGCSVADLTGQPYLPSDRASAEGLTALRGIRLVLNDFGPMDVPDLRPRPPEELTSLADRANEDCGQANYVLAGRDVGALLAESQASALTVVSAERGQAFTVAVTACFVAGVVSSRAGNIDLAATAARRGYDLAQQHNDAIRHLDTADRIAPQRIRNDPLARELVRTLHERAPHPVWELDSLRNRFGTS